MKIILLTQYFPPETGAPQNRLLAIARDLSAEGAEVSVLTAMPNYPEMRIHRPYRGKLHMKEMIGAITVHRVWLFVSAGRGILMRLFNYFSFVITSLFAGLIKLRRSDVLFVESPPLFLGITAILLARAKRCELVFNVSDLWPESAVQLGLVKNRSMIAASTWLEMKCYRNAALITGQTKGIVANIKERCPGKKVIWLPNGFDQEAIASATTMRGALERLGIARNMRVFTYAGIIGHAQGLDVLIRAADKLRNELVLFLLIGDGPVKQDLIRSAKELGVEQQVRFLDRMERHEVLSIVKESDAVVVPLRKNDLFKGAIPSKIFEAMALERPILLGVDGEARELFVEEGKAGTFFVPEDADSLANAIKDYLAEPDQLRIHGKNGSEYVRRNFDRRVISLRLWDELQKIVQR